MPLPKDVLALILAVPVFSAETVPANDSFAAHEWGTFTSVAGEHGGPVQWAPLYGGSADLPCFVHRLSPLQIKMAPAFVRMETPVLYFYPKASMTLSVHVDFPQGWITEWYPQATRVKPEAAPGLPFQPTFGEGRIEWNGLQVSPGDDAKFPSSRGASRYYAARNTDSTPLRIGNEAEKLIFYRGIANFKVPLRAKFTANGKLELRNTGPETIPMAIVFENRNGTVGYRVTSGVKDSAVVDLPELSGNLVDLRQRMADSLVEFGLYKKEALAMLETWKDSWFEDGMRVIYIVPRSFVDAQLPLNIAPSPTELMRVFVGRVELLSPWTRQTIETALAQQDRTTLRKFDRFLLPFMLQMRGRLSTLGEFGPVLSDSRCIE